MRVSDYVKRDMYALESMLLASMQAIGIIQSSDEFKDAVCEGMVAFEAVESGAALSRLPRIVYKLQLHFFFRYRSHSFPLEQHLFLDIWGWFFIVDHHRHDISILGVVLEWRARRCPVRIFDFNDRSGNCHVATAVEVILLRQLLMMVLRSNDFVLIIKLLLMLEALFLAWILFWSFMSMACVVVDLRKHSGWVEWVINWDYGRGGLLG